MDFHLLCNQTNNPNLITTQIDGKVIAPRYEDRNKMPYHACLLLLWNAHINIQYIIFSYWSYCLFIYIMKCEPHGTLNLNKKNVE